MSIVKGLDVGSGLILPLDAVTEPIAILAVRRAGKSNAAVVMAEEMHRNNLHWIAIDPKGDWFGIRSSKDGKGPGLPIAIFGGQHGDVPLEPTSGQMIADLIVDQRVSCVLDVSGFESEAAKIRFLLAFGDRLFRRKDRSQEPTHVFFEEVDDYCPQKPFHEQARLVHVMARILKQGGSRGLGGTIISQRSAVVNKDLLTQAQTLFALRTTSPQDRKAIKDWVSFFGENPNIIESLPSLGDGEAWVWSPNWLKQTKKFKFHRRSTFDSGSTPKVGGSRQAPATLADIDIDAIRDRMKETVARAEANDPAKLKAKVADLERKLAVAEKSTGTPTATTAAQTAELKREASEWKAKYVLLSKETRRTNAALDKAMSLIIDKEREFTKAVKSLQVMISAESSKIPEPEVQSIRLPEISKGVLIEMQRTIERSVQARKKEQVSNLPPGELAVLTAAIQHSGVERKNLTVLTGYKRSSRDAYIQRLQQKGLVEIQGTMVIPTEAGSSALSGDVEPLPVGQELIDFWMNRLPEGEKKSLEVLINAGGRDIARTTIDEETGYKRSSRDAYLQRLKARGLVEFTGAGMVRASDLLFPGGLS